MTSISLILAVALLTGIVSQLLANFLRIPGIVILLFVGIILGQDGTGLIATHYLGDFLPEIVSSSVAIILFEGGLGLKFSQLKFESKMITRLITSGALITAAGGTLAARLFLHWDWRLCLLFGTLVIVTGPTVIAPLLQRIKVRKNIRTILNAEAVLIDPIGAILALVVLEVIVSASDSSMTHGLLEFLSRFGFGVVAGLAAGFLLASLLKWKSLVPAKYANIFTLATILSVFHGCNGFMPESGIMAVTLSGIVVGNLNVPFHKELLDFKEQLTVMLIGMLFVLLAADIRLSSVFALGYGGIYVVAALIFIVRPLQVHWCSRGLHLTWAEIAFISWLSPRGIVAAAVASLFSTTLTQAGIDGGEALRAAVFLVITSTVVIQGLLASPLSQLLGVRLKQVGFLIFGAHSLSRLMAKILRHAGEEVTLVDRSETNINAADALGFRAIDGDALSPSILKRAHVELKRYIISATANDTLNLMILRRCRQISKNGKGMVATKSQQFDDKSLSTALASQMFGGQFDVNEWSHMIDSNRVQLIKAKIESPKVFNAAVIDGYFQKKPLQMLPLFLEVKSNIEIFSKENAALDCQFLYLLIYAGIIDEVEGEAAQCGIGSFSYVPLN